MKAHDIYWVMIWKRFYAHPTGRIALWVVIAFCLVGIYAPLLASSKPLVVQYEGVWYFPLFRYLFFPGFYTKKLDIFFNMFVFTFPLIIAFFNIWRGHLNRFWLSAGVVLFLQLILFIYWQFWPVQDPEFSRESLPVINTITEHPSWVVELSGSNDYAKLNALLRYQQQKRQNAVIESYVSGEKNLPTLWNENQATLNQEIEQLKAAATSPEDSKTIAKYIEDRNNWFHNQSAQLKYEVMPLIRPFHWEQDAGGSQSLNRKLPFWEMTRINRKDFVAALIFGVRISLVVGVLAISIALLIGVPIGAYAGYYGGRFDIVVSRLLEIWEAMPTFFMLLMVVAMFQSKSIFLVIAVIGVFGWTSFSRYIRGEFFKQRNLSYIEACRAMGFRDNYIIFSHIMPNTLPPILTLIPFAIMGAITSEAGLSFLGLGEEGSCSWGVLMDEGRSSFPGESYLLWPPAILLTTLLVAIALVGDSLRDALDPKMQH